MPAANPAAACRLASNGSAPLRAMKTLGLVVGACLVLAWLHTTPSAAPAVRDAGPQRAQFRASSDLVEVYVTATSKSGAGVHDLRGDEFELYEDGKRRDITVFSTMVQPLSVALVLDHSGSTDNELSVPPAPARVTPRHNAHTACAPLPGRQSHQ